MGNDVPMIFEAFQAGRDLIFEDVLPHLPSHKFLYMLVPLFMQAMLLKSEQTDTNRMLRMALIPFGIYTSIQILRHDFLPRDAFRPYNFIKNLALPVGVQRTLEYGLARNSYRWLGHSSPASGDKLVHEEKREESSSLLSLETWIFAISLLSR